MSEVNKSNLINPKFSERGYIQVYTGDGKGKTTAALGLTMRALGRGWRVLIIMFAKGGDNYGELYAFKNHPVFGKQLEIVQAGLNRIIYSYNINENDKIEITNGWEIAKKEAKTGRYNMIVMDEANIAIDFGLINLDDMLNFLNNKPPELEVVITGRRAHEKIIQAAHLVSEIRPIKHYWNIGVAAREGIEF